MKEFLLELRFHILLKLDRIRFFRLLHNTLHYCGILKDRYNCFLNEFKAIDDYHAYKAKKNKNEPEKN